MSILELAFIASICLDISPGATESIDCQYDIIQCVTDDAYSLEACVNEYKEQINYEGIK